MRARHFIVTAIGRGSFPLDMLRHSQLYPQTPADVEGLEGSRDRRLVRLCMDNANIGKANQCVERFASFGWSASFESQS